MPQNSETTRQFDSNLSTSRVWLAVISGFIATLVFVLTGGWSSAQQLVLNNEFENPGASSFTSFTTATGSQGSVSAAADWGVWHNQAGTTTTEHGTYAHFGLTPFDGRDPNSNFLLKVTANANGNGLAQQWSSFGTGPLSAVASAWIYMDNPGNSYSVGMGIGNGGSTSFSTSTNHDGWQQIHFSETTSPVNEIVFYSNSGDVEFYIDDVSVNAVPEPASASVVGFLTLGGVSFMRRRKRR